MDYVVSALEMAEMDRQTIEDLAIPGRVLMEVAGRAVADACKRRLSRPGKVTVACGPGNNGGDGYVAARVLGGAGHDVAAYVFAERARVKGDAHATLVALEKSGLARVVMVGHAHDLVDFAQRVQTSELVVDALLGVGLASDVHGLAAEAISIVNEGRRPVVAVDVPSGVDSNTGAVLGRAVLATHTVTFAFAKRGHYLYPGAELRGELEIADIGIPRRLAEKLRVVGRVLTAADVPALVPRRLPDAHKGNFGTVVVVAGSPDTPGAALLAARGALRSGAGLVRWATDPATLASVRAVPPDLMLLVRAEGDDAGRWAERLLEPADAVVLGPGLSTTPERLADLEALLARARVPVCVDADGLTLLARRPSPWAELRAPLVLTPHPKELSRLSGQRVEDIQRDRFAAALEFSLTSNAIVVLKGAGTVVAEPDGVVSVAAVGNPGLATGGTGDVLAGLIGGLLAQGLEPAVAAQAGVLIHGAAGDLAAARLGQAGVTASDVADELGTAWARAGR